MVLAPNSLVVSLYGDPVGSLSRLPGNTIGFLFTPQYASDTHRPTLSLGFYNALHQLRTRSETEVGSAPPFFANLLPENDLRRYVAQRAGVSKNDDFALLWVTGDDLPGAAMVSDPQGRTVPPPTEGGPEIEPPNDEVLRFSLPGVQLKFSALDNPRGGLTIPVQGRDGHWIVKLPSRHHPHVPENEYAMMRFANAVGIDIPQIGLVNLDSVTGLPAEAAKLKGQALAVKRFDRADDGQRIHIEDFNQIYRQPPGAKYENRAFADLCQTVYRTIGNDALIDLVHRIVFNVGIANNDMHLKNWSVIYPDRISPQLAPAYDYLCTKVYLEHNETGLAIGSARFFPQVSADQVLRMAKRADVSAAVTIAAARDMVDRMLAVWPTIQSEMPFPDLTSTISQQLAATPIFAERPRSIPVRQTVPTGANVETHEEIA